LSHNFTRQSFSGGGRLLILISSTIFCLFSLPKIINYYSSDIALATATRLDSYSEIIKAYKLRPDEPTILSQASLISAKFKQVNNALAFSAKALTISPYDVNLWKETDSNVSLSHLRRC